MKKLLKIIILAVVAGATYKYLTEKEISVADLAGRALERVSSLVSDFAESVGEQQKNHIIDRPAYGDENTSDINRSGLSAYDSGIPYRHPGRTPELEADSNPTAILSPAPAEMRYEAVEYVIAAKPSSGRERFSELDNYAMNVPAQAEATMESLVAWLMKPAYTELEKARLIFTWIATHVSYDDYGFNSGNYSDTSPEGVFRNRVSVCQGYSELFTRLCDIARLEAHTITGYAKGITYQKGQTITGTNHAWNIIRLDGRYRLFDVTWAAGYGKAVRGKLVSVSEFNDFWFDVSPADFIFSHLPEDDMFQFLVPTITQRQFERLPYVSGLFFKMGFSGNQCLGEFLAGTLTTLPQTYLTSYDIKVVSMPWSGTLQAGEVIRIRIMAEEGVTPAYQSGGKITRMQPEGGMYTATIRLEPGEFALMTTTGGGSYETVLEYVVE
ncbi:MAG: hypothetical protein IH591_15165 [Bacteroidales bacterium]|nr:hypothetical protein [Bacteroidales bacterium]